VTAAALLGSLAVRDFRNIAAAELSFPADGVVIVGDNGQGKTNLVEAVAYLRLQRSLRGARDRDLIRFDAAAFHIAAELGGVAAHRASVGVDRVGRKKVTLDGGEPEKLTDALDALPSVSFSPRDVDLIAGAPAERRRYLDITLALTSPAYLHALRRYRAALVRRNAALRETAKHERRTRRADLAAVAAWEPALAENGAVLVEGRRRWVEARGALFTARCATIGEAAASTGGAWLPWRRCARSRMRASCPFRSRRSSAALRRSAAVIVRVTMRRRGTWRLQCAWWSRSSGGTAARWRTAPSPGCTRM
jgi:DNA replication and repair protein RecF